MRSINSSILTLILIVFYSVLLNAQEAKTLVWEQSIVDSLERVIQLNPNINIEDLASNLSRLNASSEQEINEENLLHLQSIVLNNIARSWIEKSIDSSKYYLSISKKLNPNFDSKYKENDEALTEALLVFNEGKNSEYLQQLEELYTYFSSISDTIKMESILIHQSNIAGRSGQNELCIEKAQKAANLLIAQNKLTKLAASYLNISISFKNIGQYEKANEYLAKAKANGDENDLRFLFRYNLAKANLKYVEGDTLGVIPYYKRGISLADSMKNEYAKGVCNFNLGNAFFQIEKYDSSKVYISRAYSIYKKLNNAQGIYLTEYKNGVNLMKTGSVQQGTALLMNALDGAKRFKSNDNIRDIAKYLSEAFEYQGNYQKALRYKKLEKVYQDSVLNTNMASSIAEMNTKFETELKEVEISNLAMKEVLNETKINHQRNWLYGLLAGLLGLMFLIFNILKQKRKITDQNRVINIALQEKETLLKEIHHRVKNNLQVVSSLLGIQSRSIKDEQAKMAIKEGRARVQSMSLIHQNLYKKDNLTGIDVQDYVPKMVQNLIATYQVNDTNIEAHFEIDDLRLDVDTIIPLGLIINELITNCIKYAWPTESSGLISVRLKEKDNLLHLSVADNGIGMENNKIDDNQSSFGHNLIRAFQQKIGATIEIKNEDGTTVEMHIKNYKKI